MRFHQRQRQNNQSESRGVRVEAIVRPLSFLIGEDPENRESRGVRVEAIVRLL